MVQLTDESGKVTKTYEYDSFGNEVNPDSKDDNPFRYCGEYYDKETEEIYLRARYYQPEVGRFLTRDTYTGESDEPLSLHLYTYCENDGVNAWDPSGHVPIALGVAAYYLKDIIATAVITYSVIGVVNDQKQRERENSIRRAVFEETLELQDVKPIVQRSGAKVYRVAYIKKKIGKLITLGKKLTYSEAFYYLCGISIKIQSVQNGAKEEK